jgi:hypothetical protein
VVKVERACSQPLEKVNPPVMEDHFPDIVD